jgi:hypothetical protein
MKGVNFIRLMLLIIVVVSSTLLYTSSDNAKTIEEKSQEIKENQSENKAQNVQILFWETIIRHLSSK